jgi:hypothetical protein
MPANKSTNKVRVTKNTSVSHPLGLIDPRPNMVTDKGTIISCDSGNFTVVVGRGSGDFHQRFHPHDLFVTLAQATGTWSYPSGDGSVVFGRAGIWASGVVKSGIPSGMQYSNGDSVFNFYR